MCVRERYLSFIDILCRRNEFGYGFLVDENKHKAIVDLDWADRALSAVCMTHASHTPHIHIRNPSHYDISSHSLDSIHRHLHKVDFMFYLLCRMRLFLMKNNYCKRNIATGGHWTRPIDENWLKASAVFARCNHLDDNPYVLMCELAENQEDLCHAAAATAALWTWNTVIDWKMHKSASFIFIFSSWTLSYWTLWFIWNAHLKSK